MKIEGNGGESILWRYSMGRSQPTRSMKKIVNSKAEIRRAIKSLENGKAPGEDKITAEQLKTDL